MFGQSLFLVTILSHPAAKAFDLSNKDKRNGFGWLLPYIRVHNKTRNATKLVAPAIVGGLGALTHTLDTLVPVIGASGFATAAAATAIGTIVGSFR
ncbi:hypothetical protein CsSME_00042924 [Camellia sinensis var. sinensis]